MFHLVIFLQGFCVRLEEHPNLKKYKQCIRKYFLFHRNQAQINLPGQPIQVKDIIFFKPLNAATKPPEDILKLYSPDLLSLLTVTGNLLETTNKRRFLSFLETVLSEDMICTIIK